MSLPPKINKNTLVYFREAAASFPSDNSSNSSNINNNSCQSSSNFSRCCCHNQRPTNFSFFEVRHLKALKAAEFSFSLSFSNLSPRTRLSGLVFCGNTWKAPGHPHPSGNPSSSRSADQPDGGRAGGWCGCGVGLSRHDQPTVGGHWKVGKSPPSVESRLIVWKKSGCCFDRSILQCYWQLISWITRTAGDI